MSLKQLEDFCKGTAESEFGAGIIDKIFVNSGILNDIIDMLPGSPKILVGHKGTGKSIIFRQLNSYLARINIPALYLTPSEIVHKEPPSETPAVLQSFYYDTLVFAVASKLGESKKGLISEDDARLAKIAIANGTNDRDFIQKIHESLLKVGSVVTDRNLFCFSSGYEKEAPNKIARLIGNNLNDKKVFFLIIDEPDDVRLDGQGGGRIWALLHACRQFSQKVPNVRCVLSLRSEIWHLLCEDSAGRKNIDQYSPLIFFLDPTDDDIRKIIRRRLQFTAENCKLALNEKSPYSFFFEGNSTQLPPPARVETSSWEDYLLKQSRGRPRDSIQLIRELAISARKNKRSKISSADVTLCAIAFSESRLKAICAEYGADFPEADRILCSFSALPFEIATDDLKVFLGKRIGEYTPRIRGVRLQNNNDGIFSLWRILHEMGFFNPRIPDSSQTLGYRHILYNEAPNFVSKNNLNAMNNVCWDIHPVYRSYLLSLSDNEIHRMQMIAEYKKNSNNSSFARRERKSARHK